MRYQDFEKVMSANRMARYLTACGNNSKTCMTLYRKNLSLSQELFTVVSCFEVALRNKIDSVYLVQYGVDWLRNAANAGGPMDDN